MAGRMISELSDASTLQNTDLIPLARGATTLKVSGLTLASSLTSTASGAFASKTDLTSLSSTVDANFALKTSITSLSSTVDTNFIPKPASASAQQVLTYDGSTTTWVASAAPGGVSGNIKAWAIWTETSLGFTTRTIGASGFNVSSITKGTSADDVRIVNFTNPINGPYAVIASGDLNTDAGYQMTNGYGIESNRIDSTSCAVMWYASNISSVPDIFFSVAVIQ